MSKLQECLNLVQQIKQMSPSPYCEKSLSKLKQYKYFSKLCESVSFQTYIDLYTTKLNCTKEESWCEDEDKMVEKEGLNKFILNLSNTLASPFIINAIAMDLIKKKHNGNALS